MVIEIIRFIESEEHWRAFNKQNRPFIWHNHDCPYLAVRIFTAVQKICRNFWSLEICIKSTFDGGSFFCVPGADILGHTLKKYKLSHFLAL